MLLTNSPSSVAKAPGLQVRAVSLLGTALSVQLKSSQVCNAVLCDVAQHRAAQHNTARHNNCTTYLYSCSKVQKR